MSKDWNAWDSWWLANYHRGTYDSTSSDGARASDVLSALEACGVPAPTGRKVAAVIYEDELPELDSNLHRIHAHGRVTDSLAESERSEALLHLARARFYEARDAAAKEQERAEEERVEAKAEELARLWHEGEGNPLHTPKWESVYEGYKHGWRAIARHVLDEDGTR